MFRALCMAASVTVAGALTGCGSGCAGSQTTVSIPPSRAASVESVVTGGACVAHRPSDCDAACTSYVIKKIGGAGQCQLIVRFNDGSAPFDTMVPTDADGCLLPQPVNVPEK